MVPTATLSRATASRPGRSGCRPTGRAMYALRRRRASTKPSPSSSSSTCGDHPYQQGEVCMICLVGEVRFSTGGHTVVLEAGDSCHYDGRAPHTLENCGTVAARVLIAATPASLEPSVRVTESTTHNGN